MRFGDSMEKIADFLCLVDEVREKLAEIVPVAFDPSGDAR